MTCLVLDQVAIVEVLGTDRFLNRYTSFLASAETALTFFFCCDQVFAVVFAD